MLACLICWWLRWGVPARAPTPAVNSQHRTNNIPRTPLLPCPALKPFHRYQTSLFPSRQYTFFTSKITHSFCQHRMPSLSHDICSVPSGTLLYPIPYPTWRVAQRAVSQIIACPGMARRSEREEGRETSTSLRRLFALSIFPFLPAPKVPASRPPATCLNAIPIKYFNPRFRPHR